MFLFIGSLKYNINIFLEVLISLKIDGSSNFTLEKHDRTSTEEFENFTREVTTTI